MSLLRSVLALVPTEPIVVLFLSTSFAYNVSFTSIGSLISYYTTKYGAAYFVYLNVAFYVVGLPTSILQRKIDTYYDTMYGSKVMFRYRLWSSLLIISALLTAAPEAGEYGMLLVAVGIGICTWASHGCVSSLASVVKHHSNIYQQIGFMAPAAFCIVLVYSMGLNADADDVSVSALYQYYGIVTVVVVQGIVSWFLLCRSDIVRNSLTIKDEKVRALILRNEINSKHGGLPTNILDVRIAMRRMLNASVAMNADAQEAVAMGGGTSSNSSSNSTSQHLLRDPEVLAHLSSASQSGRERGSERTVGGCDGGAAGDVFSPMVSGQQQPRPGAASSSSGNDSDNNANNPGSSRSSIVSEDADESASRGRHTHTDYSRISLSALVSLPSIKENLRGILSANPAIALESTDMATLHSAVSLHRWTLFITIFCSILEGSFLSYVPSGSQKYLASLLYFTRVLADLAGRAVALLTVANEGGKRYFFGSITSVYRGAVLRAVCMLFFFLYISLPERDFFRQDHFIVAYQAAFSIFSGYFSCLAYEHAAALFSEEDQRLQASQLLNISFQWACFLAVIAALLIVVCDNTIMKYYQ